MKRLLSLIAAVAVMSAIGMGTTGTASAANPTPNIAKVHFKAFTPSDRKQDVAVATITSCAGIGLVNPLLQYDFCNTNASSPGTAFFDPSGTYMSEGIGGAKTDSAMAAGWSTNGAIDALLDTTNPMRICFDVNVTSLHKAGKGAYALQNFVVSWEEPDGHHQAVYTEPAMKGPRPLCNANAIPAGAWNIWATLITQVGGAKGARVQVAETLDSADGTGYQS